MVRVSEPLYFLKAIHRLQGGATFDELREYLLEIHRALVEEATQERRAGNRRGRAAQSSSRDALWTTARDVLSELRTLRILAEGEGIPSNKAELDEARSKRYDLSPEGRALLPLVEQMERSSDAADRLLLMQYSAHKEIRTLWMLLKERGKVLIPPCGARLTGRNPGLWLDDVARELSATELSAHPSFVHDVVTRLREKLASGAPTGKIASQWLEEAIGNASLRALGVDLSYVTFESAVMLLNKYYIVGRTFYHPDLRGQLVYPIAEINEEETTVTRPRFADVQAVIRREILACLTGRGPGQYTIWGVRSEVAYALRVSDSAVDRVLSELRYDRATGPVRLAFLSDFTGALPPSVRPLIIGRDAYYHVAVLLPPRDRENDVQDAA